MSAALTVALLGPSPDTPGIRELAHGLRQLGDHPRVIAAHGGPPRRAEEDGVTVVRNWRPPEWPLTARRIEPLITHVPMTYRSLARGQDDVAHAFAAADMQAALRWAQRTGRPTVFSCREPVSRANVANTRLRKKMLERAIAEADAVTVPDDDARDAMWRWFAVGATVIEPGPGAARAYAELYRRLVAR